MKKISNKKQKYTSLYLFGEASKITFKLLFIPVFLLFFGLFLDKTLTTTPLFMAVGCIAGLFFAVYRIRSIKKNFHIK